MRTRVVVEGDIEIPYGTGVELLVATLLIHICAPICVGIAAQLTYDKVLEEAVNIKIGVVSPILVDKVVREDLVQYIVEVLFDILLLLRCNLFVIG